MILTPSIYGFNRPYIRDVTRRFAPVYCPGENYSFYCNSDYKIDDETSSRWTLRIIDEQENLVYDFQSISILNLNYTLIHFYMKDLVFPIIKDGYYYFQVWNKNMSSGVVYGRPYEVFRSNVIQVSSNPFEHSTKVRFRNESVLYGVRYDLLPDFWQEFRLPISQLKGPEIKSEREQYRESSNGRLLRNSKSFRDVIMTLEMYWSNDEDMEALSAINEHTDVYISGNKLIQLSQIKIDKASDLMNQSKATFEAIVDVYSKDTTRLEDYGDFIFNGGNMFAVSTTFVKS